MLADDPDAWRMKKRGRPAGLTDKQMRRLDVLVCRGPKANGFVIPTWSVTLVVELIEREFGLQYKVASVRRILVKMGFYQRRRVYVGKFRRIGAWIEREPRVDRRHGPDGASKRYRVAKEAGARSEVNA